MDAATVEDDFKCINPTKTSASCNIAEHDDAVTTENSMEDDFRYMYPTKELEACFIVDRDDAIVTENSMAGDWILRYPKNEMNEKWRKAVFLYRRLELDGVPEIDCTTAAPNPEFNDDSFGEIYFNCRPYTDAHKIMKIGKAIIKKMDYANSCGFINFEPENEIVEKTGKYNYTLQVPATEYHEK